MLEVISLLGVVKNYLPHPEPGSFGLLATLQLSCQTAPAQQMCFSKYSLCETYRQGSSEITHAIHL